MLGNVIAACLGILLTVGSLIAVLNPKAFQEAYRERSTRASRALTRAVGVPMTAFGIFITCSALAEIFG